MSKHSRIVDALKEKSALTIEEISNQTDLPTSSVFFVVEGTHGNEFGKIHKYGGTKYYLINPKKP
ncbi:MAG: hypothetical protein WC895_03830 [Candidatus Shapirobacteria bacterium]|jgi:hypothetical protein